MNIVEDKKNTGISASIHEEAAEVSVLLDELNKAREEVYRLQQELKEARHNYKMLADYGQALIWISGTDKLCYYFNQVWLDFTGRTLEQEYGNGWAQGVHPDDFQRCLDIYMSSFDKREAFSMDYRLMHHDGEYRWIQDDGSPCYDTNGVFVGYIGHCLDITGLKQVEADLIRAKENADAANAAKTQFLANMSHEIRTPLNGLMGMLQLLEMTELTAEQKDYIRKSKTSSELLLSVINDILDYSKINAGMLELEMAPIETEGLISGVVDLFESSAIAKGLALTYEIQNGIPAQIVGDPFRIRQVLSNLIGNALKFTTAGGVHIQVKSLADPHKVGDYLEFIIRDTGIGIPIEKIPELFNRFSQVDSSNTRKYGGTGLGLAICQGIVEKMGGTIWAESTVGVGSEFHFTCIMIPAEAASASDGEQPAVTADVKERERKVRILYVEDDQVSGMVMTGIAAKKNWEVQVAECGADAMALYQENEFDIILMDVQMPDMDGYTASGRIRSIDALRGQRTPIIAVTAHALSGDMEKSLEAGMDDYLAKPIDVAKLCELVDEWVR